MVRIGPRPLASLASSTRSDMAEQHSVRHRRDMAHSRSRKLACNSPIAPCRRSPAAAHVAMQSWLALAALLALFSSAAAFSYAGPKTLPLVADLRRTPLQRGFARNGPQGPPSLQLRGCPNDPGSQLSASFQRLPSSV